MRRSIIPLRPLIAGIFLTAIISLPVVGGTIYVDDDGPADFSTIQAAIDDANDGDAIVVKTGLYKNDIYFLGKNITLNSTNPHDLEIIKATTIGCEEDEAKIIFNGSEDASCILTGFNINGYVQGCETRIAPICECENHTHATISHCIFQGNCGLCGIVIMCCDGTISNCLIADNKQCGFCSAAFIYPTINECHGQIINCTITNNDCCSIFITDGTLTVENCIIYYSHSLCENGIIYIANSELNISYNDFKGGLNSVISYNSIVNWGPGNIDEDPCFTNLNNGDYHFKSQAGRWDPNSQTWVKDDVTSPCIDAGDPRSPIGYEPFPNGGVINMGAYGGTNEASKSYFGEPLCETIVAGDINGDCKVDFFDLQILVLHWLEKNS